MKVGTCHGLGSGGTLTCNQANCSDIVQSPQSHPTTHRIRSYRSNLGLRTSYPSPRTHILPSSQCSRHGFPPSHPGSCSGRTLFGPRRAHPGRIYTQPSSQCKMLYRRLPTVRCSHRSGTTSCHHTWSRWASTGNRLCFRGRRPGCLDPSPHYTHLHRKPSARHRALWWGCTHNRHRLRYRQISNLATVRHSRFLHTTSSRHTTRDADCIRSPCATRYKMPWSHSKLRCIHSRRRTRGEST